MPGGDGTGPMGMGAMTGRGARRCGTGGGFWRRGGGRGWRGRCGMDATQAIDERTQLEGRVDALSAQLDAVKQRLSELNERGSR